MVKTGELEIQAREPCAAFQWLKQPTITLQPAVRPQDAVLKPGTRGSLLKENGPNQALAEISWLVSCSPLRISSHLVQGGIYHLATGRVEFLGRSPVQAELLSSSSALPPSMASLPIRTPGSWDRGLLMSGVDLGYILYFTSDSKWSNQRNIHSIVYNYVGLTLIIMGMGQT